MKNGVTTAWSHASRRWHDGCRSCAGVRTRPCSTGLDNEEVCLLLNIQKRTLQRYRERGLIPCTQIRHKVYYKTTDVERLLASAAYRCRRQS